MTKYNVSPLVAREIEFSTGTNKSSYKNKFRNNFVYLQEK